MIGKYDYNLLEKFYTILNDNIEKYLSGTYKESYSKVDPLMQKILMNNACGFSDDSSYASSETIIDNEYIIYFIIGAVGNEVNKCFDFVEFNGMNYLIIFLDKFNGLDSALSFSDDEISYIAKAFMGKSYYFDIITKLVNIFTSTTSNPAVFTNSLSTTCAGLKYRYAPFIIAGKIILNITGELTDNDIYGGVISYDDLIKLIDNFNLSLYGIYKM